MPDEVERRLREIEERVSKATEPPWSDDRGLLWMPSVAGMLEAGMGVPRQADAAFCAHAREDVPWLLALLREREEENRRLREALAAIRDYAAPRSDLSVYVEIMYEMASDAIRGEQP